MRGWVDGSFLGKVGYLWCSGGKGATGKVVNRTIGMSLCRGWSQRRGRSIGQFNNEASAVKLVNAGSDTVHHIQSLSPKGYRDLLI